MKFLTLLLTAFTITYETTSADRKCHGVWFNQRYYDISVLKDGINHVHKLVFNHNDNTLYFTLDQLALVPTRILGYFNIDTSTAGLVDGIRNATAVTIDQAANAVYVGGSDGIYVLNKNKIPEKLPVQDNIQSLFFNNDLYYVNNRKEAFIYRRNGFISPLQELHDVAVEDLIVDDDKNIFFLKDKKLFRVKIGTRAVNSHERYTVNAITTDEYYRPYICATDGVYVYNKYKYVFDKVSNVTSLKALTFNRMNEPIYVVADILIKLNTTSECHEY